MPTSLRPSVARAPRHTLAEFLKAKRARLSPSVCGFPVGTRRRTPGLRREELAQLAGISATWYTWIEQGRELAVSAAAWTRIADALQLNEAERRYLFELTGKKDPVAKALVEVAVPASLRAAVDAIKAPAYVLGRCYEPLVWNRAAAELFSGWLKRQPPLPTLLEYVFLDRSARRFVVGWPLRAGRLVAEFRADASSELLQPDVQAAVSSLAERSAEFRRFWTAHDVVEREGGVRAFKHPTRGALRYEQVNLRVALRADFKLVMLIEARAKR